MRVPQQHEPPLSAPAESQNGDTFRIPPASGASVSLEVLGVVGRGCVLGPLWVLVIGVHHPSRMP